MPGIGGTTIDAPGSPYNGKPAMWAMGDAAANAKSSDPATKAQGIADLKMLSALPQFQGFGWQGFLAMAGIMAGGALASAITGSGAGAGAGASTGADTGAAAGGTTTAGDVGATTGAIGSVGGPVGAPLPTVAGAGASGGSGILSSIATGIGGRLLPTLISSGTSLVGGLLGANTANSAAQLQAQAANHAADLQAKTAADALAFQRETLAQQQANAQPWLTAGAGALTKIGDITANPFVLPTAEEAAQTPGYQFQLQEGQKALEAYERAHGVLLSGKAAKDIDAYGQGVASTNYQNVVQNSLAARNANLNPLLSEAGLGQVATGNLNQNLSTGANLNTNTQLTSAENVGNLSQQAAQSTASGYVGGSNAITGALNSIGNNFTNLFSPGGGSGSISIAQLIAALQKSGAGATG